MQNTESAPGLCPEDWTLDDLKAVATDLERNGTSSKYYVSARWAMESGVEYAARLTNKRQVAFRVIGVLHDDAADGSGKAGLTFMAWNDACGNSRMNATYTNVGGWEASELRGKMNSGEIWQLFPSDFQSKVVPVTKLTNNVGGTSKSAAPTLTTDRLFLLSYSESADDVSKTYSDWKPTSWLASEGSQYEALRGKVTDATGSNSHLPLGSWWWERSCSAGYSGYFLGVGSYGGPSHYDGAAIVCAVLPAFSF